VLNRFENEDENIVAINDPIQHVVLLMMENHSFDQMLGCFQEKYPELEGVDPGNPRFNLDDKGNKIFQKATTEKQMNLDPIHEVDDVLKQIDDNNSGFVKDFVANYPNSSIEDRQNVMGYYPKGFLPALHTLADEFTICDHWFSSLPGPTWPNRFFALSGTSNGRVKMPSGLFDPEFIPEVLNQKQKTIFDCLDEAKKSWRTYFYDFPISLVFSNQRELHHLKNYHKIDSFFKDVNGDHNNFPAFTFIEPKYLGVDQNDDHPPHNTMKAQKLIADVYNAIRSNPKLWESTLLVITYDEHGGFYDHVHPPAAPAPDAHAEEYDFKKLGVRVPALLISPWVRKGVEKTQFDHTSLLKYLSDKWNLSLLGERTRQANSIATALHFEDGPRQNCTSFISIPYSDLIPSKPDLEKRDENANHQAIHFFADFINQKPQEPTTPSCFDSFKFSVGKALTSCGMWLSKEEHARKNARIDLTNDITNKLIASSRHRPVPEEQKNESPISQNTESAQLRLKTG
jgi:phospholipase C